MTQRFSQNGWPAYATTEYYARFTAAGQGWWAANADVAVVFTEFIGRFVREVEPISGKVLDDWSYANRLVRGSTSVVSNHGSATAIDLNALKHPRGVPNTFSPAEQRTMHRIRDAITDDAGRPVLRLGMDYTSTVDDMHVEIDANAARVRQAANKIRALNQEDDVSFSDQHKLTEADVAAFASNALKVGQPISYDSLVRFPPATERLRREQAAQHKQLVALIGSQNGTIAALAAALKAGGSLTEQQAQAAAEAGAAAALAKLGDLLDGPA